METFVSVDYHKRFSYGAIMNAAGEILKEGRFANHSEAVAAFLGPYAGPSCCAVLEATRNWCVMYDWLEAQVGEVKLAHPRKVRAIAEAKIKTDKIDAQTLAHLLRADLIPEAYVCSPMTRVLKNLVRHRVFLVRVQTMAKNRIHVLLDRHPVIRAEYRADALFSGKGIGWMRSVELPASDRLILDKELDLLEFVRDQLRELARQLNRVATEDPRADRLTTIPGIGKTLALLLLSEIDDIGRFRSARKLHAYAGLVPSTHASGGRTYHGRIIKQGNKAIRWAMVEAVWPAIRKDDDLRRYYERLRRRKGPNPAKVATARRLLTIVYRVLKENREYRHAA
jgi:transposase